MPPYSVSPSLIAQYFFHECPRFLRFHSMPQEERRASGIPIHGFNQALSVKALLKAGIDWEEEVVTKKFKGKVWIAEKDYETLGSQQPLHSRIHDIPATVGLLQTLKPGEAIYQPTLPIPDSFLDRHNLEKEVCQFPPCRPDLIHYLSPEEVHLGVPTLRIIDIKASDALKSSHRIQVAIYSMILSELLDTERIDLPLDLHNGAIWLSGADRPELFDLSTAQKIVAGFFEEQLKPTLTCPWEEVPWHLYYRCEWCEFYEYCRAEAEKTESVSLIPFMTVYGRNLLREAPWSPGKQIQSLSDLEIFLKKPAAGEWLNTGGSLRNAKDRLTNNLMSMKTGKVIPQGSFALAFPKGESVRLVLSLQQDPVSGKVYVAGFQRVGGKVVFGSPYDQKIFIATRKEECGDIGHAFLNDLSAILHQIDGYNRKQVEWRNELSLQTYVFDAYEARLFNNLLQESLDIPDIAETALTLLFHYQDTTLSHADEHPGDTISFPLITLSEIIRMLVALPIPVYYRLPEILEALPSPTFPFKFPYHENFWFNLSNMMRSDAILQVWSGRDQGRVQAIEREIKNRLLAASAIIDGIRHKASDQLFAYTDKFRLPSPWNFRHPECSRIAFIVRYESYMGAREMREKRCLPKDERIAEGISVPVIYKGQDRWKLAEPIDEADFDRFGSDFLRILAPDSSEGDRAQMAYDDFKKRKNRYPPKNSILRLGSTGNRAVDKKTGKLLELTFKETNVRNDLPPLKEGERALIHPLYTDYNSDRLIDALHGVDDRENPLLLQIIHDPLKAAVESAEPPTIRDRAVQIGGRLTFTKSQEKAFQHLLRNRLSLIWGPPGTGKTAFLARAILAYIQSSIGQKPSCRVFVTAFTHAAIENLLDKIIEVKNQYGFTSTPEVFKVEGIKFDKFRQKVPALEKVAVANRVAEKPFLVLGGTVYQYIKFRDSFPGFDLLVVDEASQMKFGEFAAVSMAIKESGKLVLCGDHLQLPPIIKGEYPASEDGLPGLEDSIFRYVKQRDHLQKPAYTSQLLENHRMNTTLCRFLSENLYGDGYQPYKPEIANRAIKLAPRKYTLPLEIALDRVLDPNYPLVLVIIENFRATVENLFEAELVARLGVMLRERLFMKTRQEPYPYNERGDIDFWRHGLAIVSPHHAQITAISRALAELREWNHPPLVETVDKMQGQQSQAVIVSYGVSDVETAFSEAEFIYSLNRLNVSVSRAEAKCIVFLPRPLLTPSFELLGNEEALAGLDYMLALQEFCRKYGEETELSVQHPDFGELEMTIIRARVVE